jgi:hypothetical protein
MWTTNHETSWEKYKLFQEFPCVLRVPAVEKPEWVSQLVSQSFSGTTKRETGQNKASKCYTWFSRNERDQNGPTASPSPHLIKWICKLCDTSSDKFRIRFEFKKPFVTRSSYEVHQMNVCPSACFTSETNVRISIKLVLGGRNWL